MKKGLDDPYSTRWKIPAKRFRDISELRCTIGALCVVQSMQLEFMVCRSETEEIGHIPEVDIWPSIQFAENIILCELKIVALLLSRSRSVK